MTSIPENKPVSVQISVLLSVHNGAKTLKKCLESVCKQTFNQISIIIIDDYSTDDTLKVLKSVQADFPQIPFTILRNEENIGLTRSLNRGLKNIHSPYTARIDADDWWHPDKLAHQISFLEDHSEYGIVGCNYANCIGDKQKPITKPETDEAIRASIIRRNPFAHSCVMFNTELIRSLGGYDNSVLYGQDYELWLRAYPHTKYYNLQEYLCFRSAEQGISMERQRQQMWQGIKTQVKYIRKYQFPITNYLYLLELLLLVILPDWMKKFKRKIFS